jgi:hypothetical protein
MVEKSKERFMTLYRITPLVFLLLLSPHGLPALMIEYDLNRLVAESTDVITGEVIKKESIWNEKKTVILTDVTLNVTETVKGEKKETIFVRYPGGNITSSDGTGIGMGRSDQPRFQVGEHVMLFLNKHKEDKTMKITGQFQGKFIISQEPVTKEYLVTSPSKVLAHPETLKTRKTDEFTVPLSIMKKRIKEIMTEQENPTEEETRE